MANRFSQMPQPYVVNPISAETFAAIPIAKAKTMSTALTAANRYDFSFNVGDKDVEATQELLDPIQHGKDKLVERIVRDGVSSDMVGDIMNLNKGYSHARSMITVAEDNKKRQDKWEQQVLALHGKESPKYAEIVKQKELDKWGGSYNKGEDGTIVGTKTFDAGLGPKYFNVGEDLYQATKGIKAQIQEQYDKGVSFRTVKDEKGNNHTVMVTSGGKVVTSNEDKLVARLNSIKNQYLDPSTERGQYYDYMGLSDREVDGKNYLDFKADEAFAINLEGEEKKGPSSFRYLGAQETGGGGDGTGTGSVKVGKLTDDTTGLGIGTLGRTADYLDSAKARSSLNKGWQWIRGEFMIQGVSTGKTVKHGHVKKMANKPVETMTQVELDKFAELMDLKMHKYVTENPQSGKKTKGKYNTLWDYYLSGAEGILTSDEVANLKEIESRIAQGGIADIDMDEVQKQAYDEANNTSNDWAFRAQEQRELAQQYGIQPAHNRAVEDALTTIAGNKNGIENAEDEKERQELIRDNAGSLNGVAVGAANSVVQVKVYTNKADESVYASTKGKVASPAAIVKTMSDNVNPSNQLVEVFNTDVNKSVGNDSDELKNLHQGLRQGESYPKGEGYSVSYLGNATSNPNNYRSSITNKVNTGVAFGEVVVLNKHDKDGNVIEETRYIVGHIESDRKAMGNSIQMLETIGNLEFGESIPVVYDMYVADDKGETVKKTVNAVYNVSDIGVVAVDQNGNRVFTEPGQPLLWVEGQLPIVYDDSMFMNLGIYK